MPVEPYADQELLSAHFRNGLAQDVYDDGVPDPYDMTWTNGVLLPYVVIEYGMPIAAGGGRSISTEEKQPTVNRVSASVVSSSGAYARQVASKIVGLGTGFVPSTNTGPLRLSGNTSFSMQVENRPAVYVTQVHFSYDGNMAEA